MLTHGRRFTLKVSLKKNDKHKPKDYGRTGFSVFSFGIG